MEIKEGVRVACRSIGGVRSCEECGATREECETYIRSHFSKYNERLLAVRKYIYPKQTKKGTVYTVMMTKLNINKTFKTLQEAVNYRDDIIAEHEEVFQVKGRLITYQGISRTPKEWEKICGIPSSVIQQRIYKYGYSVDRALTEPVREHQKRLKLKTVIR